jgi:programmed cell death protein 5
MPDNQAEFEAMKKSIMKKVLTKQALERLGSVRLANPIVASQLEVYLMQLSQTGQIKQPIDDEKLKNILSVLMPVRSTTTKIKRK